MKFPDKKTYNKMSSQSAPKSPIFKDCAYAFVIGGLICALGQSFIEIYTALGISQDITLPLASVTLVFISAFLTGLGLYDKIATRAGAGTLVPITGFANSISAPAVEFKTEGFILGLGAKMFIIAGPVIVYGTAASVIYGIIYWITTLF
ncbi:MAG: stage V sporulation protein AC [Oscillospiraceae bacterium]|nr:stage V sporulation protein AC [Oscillospiraceae bacterium]